MAQAIAWSDELECPSGAIVLANTDDLAHWPGQAAAAPGAAAITGFGDGHSAFLWHALPGTVRLSVDGARDWLCLAQVEYAENETCRAAAYAFALAYPSAAPASGLHYRVTRGPVALACAGASVRASSTAVAALPLAASTPGALIDLAHGASAAALWLQPGEYAASLYFHEEDRWGVSWCRLLRL